MRALLATLLFSLAAPAAPFTWTGAAGSGRWADAGNWAGGAVPPDDGTADVAFAASGTVALDGTRVVSTLSVSTAGDVTLQAGSQPQSSLVVRGAGLSRSAAGKLVVQVPVFAAGSIALSGFEPQTAFSTATTFGLTLGAWPGAASVTQAVLSAESDAVPPSSRLDLGAGSALDVNGRTLGLGSLSGSGSVINSSSGKGTLVVGFDGSDSLYSGDLGTALSGQPDNGYIDLLKVGGGTLTTSGSLRLGGLFGRIRVLEGTLVVAGSISGFFPILAVESSSGWHGTIAGTGSVGLLQTSDNSVPGATVSPGSSAARGILHAQNCDLRRGTLAIRVAAYGTAGTDYDQLDCGNGNLQFDADTEVIVDLGGSSVAGGPIPIATYGNANGPNAPDPSQVLLINNPAGLVATLNPGPQSLTLTVKAPTASSTPLFRISPAHGLVTSEQGRTASFTVSLGQAPSKNVTMPVASDNTAEGTVSTSSLTFTPANWSTPQTVTVTGVDDAVPDGNVAYGIVLGPCTSMDATYRNQSPPRITAVNLDDDAVSVTPLTGLVAQPAGLAQLTFTFHAPVSGTQDLWLQLRSSDPALAWPSPAMVHVTATNGVPAPQTVTLSGAHSLQAGCTPFTLTGSVLSTDGQYDGYELPLVSACNQGDRAPIASGFALVVDPGSAVHLAAPGVLAYAFDPDGDPLTAQLVTGPAHGSLTLNPDGTLTYVPDAGYSGQDSFTYAASDGVFTAPGADVQIQVGAPPDLAGFALTLDGGDMPGADLALHALVTNLGAAALSGVRLELSSVGIELLGANGPAGALVTSGSDVWLDDLPAGESVQIDLPARITAGSGGRAGAAATLWSASAERLAAPKQAYIEVSRLRFDAGGCGCRTANPGGALLWLGALVLLLPRRRSAPPGRVHLDARRRLIARHLGPLPRSSSEGIDGDDRDPLPSFVQPDVDVELAGRRHLDGLSLHIDPAAGSDAAADRDRAAVGLVAGPLDREQHLLEGAGGLAHRAGLQVHHLVLVQLDRLSRRCQGDRPAGRRHHHALALGGEEEVSAGALGDRFPALDLQRNAAAPLLDVRLDPSAHARAQHPGRDGGQAKLGAVVQLDPDAVDRELRLAVAGRAQPVADADAVSQSRGTPGAVLPLQLDLPFAAQEQRRFRSACVGGFGARDWCRRRRLPSTPAGLHTHKQDGGDCGGTGAHASSYTGARGSIAMMAGKPA